MFETAEIAGEFIKDWFGSVLAASKEPETLKAQELLFSRAAEIMVENGWSRRICNVNHTNILDFTAILINTLAVYKISENQLFSKIRVYLPARLVLTYLARKLLKMSYAEIGQQFGGRDHTTIMYYMKKAEESLGDPDFIYKLNVINNELKKCPNYFVEVPIPSKPVIVEADVDDLVGDKKVDNGPEELEDVPNDLDKPEGEELGPNPEHKEQEPPSDYKHEPSESPKPTQKPEVSFGANWPDLAKPIIKAVSKAFKFRKVLLLSTVNSDEFYRARCALAYFFRKYLDMPDKEIECIIKIEEGKAMEYFRAAVKLVESHSYSHKFDAIEQHCGLQGKDKQ